MLPEAVPRRVPGRLAAVVDDRLLVLHPADGRLHVLSQSAAVVYTSVDASASVAEIADGIGADLEVCDAELVADVTDALASLQHDGLVDFEAPTPGDRPSLTTHLRGPTEGRPQPESWCVLEPGDIGPLRAGAAVLGVRASPALVDLVGEALGLLPAASASTTRVDALISVVDAGEGRFEVWCGGEPVAAPQALHDAAQAVLGAVNQVAATRPVGAIRLHGGVVAKDGRAVVVCGDSGAGKSTLVSALVQCGWSYLTDEVAVIEGATLSVTPYPKWIDLTPDVMGRLGLNPSGHVGPPGPKCHVPPALVGPVGDGGTVVGIVMLAIASETPAPAKPIEAIDAITALIANTFATTWDDPGGLQSLTDLCTTTTVVELARTELQHMVAQVDDLFG